MVADALTCYQSEFYEYMANMKEYRGYSKPRLEAEVAMALATILPGSTTTETASMFANYAVTTSGKDGFLSRGQLEVRLCSNPVLH